MLKVAIVAAYALLGERTIINNKVSELLKPLITDEQSKNIIKIYEEAIKNNSLQLIQRRLFTTSEKRQFNSKLISFYNQYTNSFTIPMEKLMSMKKFTKVQTDFTIQKYLTTFRKGGIPCINNNESLPEAITRLSYLLITNKLCNKVRPKWIINPKTNRRLEIDIYDLDNKVCIEYNGAQHYDPKKNQEQDGNTQIFRDTVKRKCCKENNMELFEIPYCIEYNLIVVYLMFEIKKRKLNIVHRRRVLSSSNLVNKPLKNVSTSIQNYSVIH